MSGYLHLDRSLRSYQRWRNIDTRIMVFFRKHKIHVRPRASAPRSWKIYGQLRYDALRVMDSFTIAGPTSDPDLNYTYSYTSILRLGLAAGDTPDAPISTSGPEDRALRHQPYLHHRRREQSSDEFKALMADILTPISAPINTHLMAAYFPHSIRKILSDIPVSSHPAQAVSQYCANITRPRVPDLNTVSATLNHANSSRHSDISVVIWVYGIFRTLSYVV
ncbi:hypothetical protein F511_25269 [Dorcoceras hygrometricum]|uniref:Uncharacterized protein n=1 Tax=Dorcoceras hygrometricum TaxID=472368 RepID=A0A2Z7B946_9LAMI|nr:hypothetical protein F511_25269 [Dorcoceras hygrometricum]